MNHRNLLSLSFLLSLAPLTVSLLGCGGDPEPMTRHEVCERLSTAACDRLAVCEPTVSATGCHAKEMASCCPDGVCDEAVIADEDRLAACEAAVTTMSCSDLTDHDMPESCTHLTDPLPTKPVDNDPPPPPDDDPSTTGVLQVGWEIYAGGSSLTCDQFQHTTAIRIIATPPAGPAITRDVPCDPGSALTTLPLGPYSVLVQARTGSGQLVQQTQAQTVVIDQSGSVSSFTFQITTTFGQYCSQLATAVCNACAPSDTTCRADSYADCCGTDGLCGHAASADPEAFPACISAFNSGAYCSAAPPVCSGSIDVW